MSEKPPQYLLPSVETFDSLPDSAILRQPSLEALLGVSASTIWRLVNSGALPRVKLTARCTGWRVGDVRAYLNAQREAA
jgi:predicted DNA-binding transcriptional regulator AlpA